MRRIVLALLLGLAAAPAMAQTPWTPTVLPPPGATVCPGGLCQPEALTPLFEALRASEAGERTTPVHILQIGDSHTAGDRITGKLRADLQARFGNAGRGVLPAGIPYAGYAPLQVQVTPDRWVSDVAPLQGAGSVGPAFGLAGMRGKGTADSQLDLRFDPGAEADVIGACGFGRGEGPVLVVEAGGLARALEFDTGAPRCAAVTLEQPVANARLRGAGPGVVLDTVWAQRAGPGVVVSSLGVIGSTLRDFAARDEALVAEEFRVFAPGLIILAYGTNEGFDDSLDGSAYERLLTGQIARVRRLSPGVPILILGAPDALRTDGPGGCSADGQRRPPPSLAVVRDVQRRVSAEMGVAFWDWQGRMGGECSADGLATIDEPLMRRDRVHFTSEGADWIGGILANDLLNAFDAWKGQTEAGEGQ
jgi:lysophospholipase L1-like esterase